MMLFYFYFFSISTFEGVFFLGNINVNSYCMRNFVLVSICFHKPYRNALNSLFEF
jgi:hypothetical protein